MFGSAAVSLDGASSSSSVNPFASGASSSSSSSSPFGSFGASSSSSSGFRGFATGATSSSSSFGSFGATSSSSLSAFGGFGSFGATSSSSSSSFGFGGFASFGATSSSSLSVFGGFGSFGAASSSSAFGNFRPFGNIGSTSGSQDENGFRPSSQMGFRQPIQFGGSTFSGFPNQDSPDTDTDSTFDPDETSLDNSYGRWDFSNQHSFGSASFRSGFSTGMGFTPDIDFGATAQAVRRPPTASDEEVLALSLAASVEQGVREPKFKAGGTASKVYAEDLFDSPPPSPLICMVCRGVPFPKEVRRCTCCDRIACSLCHSGLGGTCSSCGSSGSSIGGWKAGSTPSLNYMLDQLAFKCPNGGCEHKVEQGGSHSMDGHLATCPLQMGSCLACHADLPRGEFEDHEGVCQFRLVGCGHCGEPVPQTDLEDHEEGCNNRPIPCPHEGCEEVVAQGDVSVHRQGCIFRPLDCPLCSQSFVGQEALEEHLNQGDDNGHVRALVQVTKGMQEEIDSLKLMVAELQKQNSAKGPSAGTGTGNWQFANQAL